MSGNNQITPTTLIPTRINRGQNNIFLALSLSIYWKLKKNVVLTPIYLQFNPAKSVG